MTPPDLKQSTRTEPEVSVGDGLGPTVSTVVGRASLFRYAKECARRHPVSTREKLLAKERAKRELARDR